ncbi:glycosyltransferase, partial [Pelagibacterales bacterium SAG-MED31]|nr:glycosyltransferase [Pelagibacterales bacterium SAG-MED31]
MINNSSKFIFLYPGNIKQKTGGYIYENNIYEYSKRRNTPIVFKELSSNYPFPNRKDLKNLNHIVNNLNTEKILIFDGLVLEGLSKASHILENFKIIALIHHPLYLEFQGNKSNYFFNVAKKIYNKVDHFIVTSSETKKLLLKKFNLNSNIISIVEPGIE